MLTFHARRLLKIDCCSWRFLLGDMLLWRWFLRRLWTAGFTAGATAVLVAFGATFLAATVFCGTFGCGSAPPPPAALLGVPFWDGTMFSTFWRSLAVVLPQATGSRLPLPPV
uniref:(northern house mosquito) hypothetical protein n=1 Tax=Culex pipiens TaxID=7175 RepID=A0A8D8GQ77_CULPI